MNQDNKIFLHSLLDMGISYLDQIDRNRRLRNEKIVDILGKILKFFKCYEPQKCGNNVNISDLYEQFIHIERYYQPINYFTFEKLGEFIPSEYDFQYLFSDKGSNSCFLKVKDFKNVPYSSVTTQSTQLSLMEVMAYTCFLAYKEILENTEIQQYENWP
jgi:hypothetical protein